MERRTSRPLHRGRTVALAAVIACGACFALAGESTLRVEDAWAAATPPGAVTAAAYMTLTSDTADRLVGALSAASRTVEVHAHVESGGVLRMTPIAALRIEPGTKAVLAPGGNHLMLVGLARPLAPGDEIVVVLEFERAGVREIALPVRDLRDPRTVQTQHDEHGQPEATAEQGGHDHGRP